MEKKYDDLKLRKVYFTYKGFVDDYANDDFHLPKSEKEKFEAELNMELDNRDEEARIMSDMIGVSDDVSSFYNFDYNGDDEDNLVLRSVEIDELDSIHNGIILRFYSSSEDLKNDDYFGRVIVDTKFDVKANNDSEEIIIKSILAEYGIESFNSSELEEKREIIDNIPVDDVVDIRNGFDVTQCGEVIVVNPGVKNK